MIGLPQLKARIGRLEKLQDGLIAETAKWKDAKSPLLPGEREAYMAAVQEAIIGLHDPRETLEDAVQRLEDPRRPA